MFFMRVLRMKWEHHSATALEKEKRLLNWGLSLCYCSGSTYDIIAFPLYYVIISPARVEVTRPTLSTQYSRAWASIWRWGLFRDALEIKLTVNSWASVVGPRVEGQSCIGKEDIIKRHSGGTSWLWPRIRCIQIWSHHVSHYHISCMRGSSSAPQLHLEFLTIPSHPIGQGYGISRLITRPPNPSVDHSEAYHFNSRHVSQEACCHPLARAFLALVASSPAYLDKWK